MSAKKETGKTANHKCPYCEGKGWWQTLTVGKVTCSHCKGTGTRPQQGATMKTTLTICLLFLSLPVFAQEAPQAVKSKFLRPEASQISKDVSQGQPRSKESFFKSWGKGFKWSTVVYVAGTGADIFTSQGKGFYEGNPLFRSRDGSVNNGRAVAAAVGIYGGTLLLERRWPRGASVIRVVVGVVRGFVAVRNLR